MALLTSVRDANLPKRPQVPFPKWDGKDESVPIFQEKLEMYQGDKFFDGVVDWTRASQATLRQARQVKLDMFDKLPVTCYTSSRTHGTGMTASPCSRTSEES